MRKITLSLLAALLLAAAVMAMAAREKAATPKAAGGAAALQQRGNQAKPADADAASKILPQFVGNWTFVDTFYSAQGQPTRSTKGTCKQYLIMNGSMLQSDFTFTPDTGAPYNGTGITVFDTGLDRWTTVWYDSRRPELSIRRSNPPFDGKTLELFSTALDPDDAGRPSVARAHFEDNGKTLKYEHFTISPGAPERKLFDIVMTKQ